MQKGRRLPGVAVWQIRLSRRLMGRGAIATVRSSAYGVRPTGSYNGRMAKSKRYTQMHAQSGLDARLPEIETWPNQFPGYEIAIDVPEFTSVCPKTGLPDFGILCIRYMPEKDCVELKSLKEYLTSYRNLGIFQENIVNRVLEDVVRATRPKWAEVKGEFRPRGGMGTVVLARYPRSSGPA